MRQQYYKPTSSRRPVYGEGLYLRRKSSKKGLFFGLLAILVVGAALVMYLDQTKSPNPGSNPDDTRTTLPTRHNTQPNTPDQTSHEPGSIENIDMQTETGTNEPGETNNKPDSPSSLDIETPNSENLNDSQIARIRQAETYLAQKDLKNALPIFQELAENDNRFIVCIGVCYYGLEDYTNARSYLEDAVRINDQDVEALKYLAYTCYKLDDLEAGLRHIENALRISDSMELQAFQRKLKREIEAMDHYGGAQRVNFNVVFSKVEHSDARDLVIEILEDAYRDVGRQLDAYPPNPISVILYNEQAFFDVTRAPGWAGGLYDGKIRIPIQGMEGQEALLKRVLFHEYTHALVHTITPRCPLWLNEGLAQYFSEENMPIVGQLIPLNLLEYRFPGGDPRLVAAAYVESYSVTVYLIDRYGLYSVKELLVKLGKGEDMETAFSSCFMTSYAQFKETWGKE